VSEDLKTQHVAVDCGALCRRYAEPFALRVGLGSFLMCDAADCYASV
jgi:hypothetical protein